MSVGNEIKVCTNMHDIHVNKVSKIRFLLELGRYIQMIINSFNAMTYFPNI